VAAPQTMPPAGSLLAPIVKVLVESAYVGNGLAARSWAKVPAMRYLFPLTGLGFRSTRSKTMPTMAKAVPCWFHPRKPWQTHFRGGLPPPPLSRETKGATHGNRRPAFRTAARRCGAGQPTDGVGWARSTQQADGDNGHAAVEASSMTRPASQCRPATAKRVRSLKGPQQQSGVAGSSFMVIDKERSCRSASAPTRSKSARATRAGPRPGASAQGADCPVELLADLRRPALDRLQARRRGSPIRS